MFEYDPVTSIQHHPTPNMKRFGTNQFGEPLFRIVWSESVRHLIGGLWPDGDTGYHWVRTYKGFACWVLEQWTMPSETPRAWNALVEPISGFPLLGPYPARGFYELAFKFEFGVDNDSLDKIVATVRHKQTRSFQDQRDAVSRDYTYEQKDSRVQAEAEVRDAVRFRGNAPLSFGRFGRGSKTTPELRSAEELGLPVPRPTRERNPTDLRGLDLTTTLTAG